MWYTYWVLRPHNFPKNTHEYVVQMTGYDVQTSANDAQTIKTCSGSKLPFNLR